MKLIAKLDSQEDVCRYGLLLGGWRIEHGRGGSSGLFEGREGTFVVEAKGIVLTLIYSATGLACWYGWGRHFEHSVGREYDLICEDISK